MTEKHDESLTTKPESLTSQSEASVSKSDSQEYSRGLLGQSFINRATELAKERIYVQDEDEAPEGLEVMEGPGETLYYETGSTDTGRNGASIADDDKEEGAPRSPTADGESLWQAEFVRNYNEGDEVTIDTEEDGKFRGTIVRFDPESREVVLNTEGRGNDKIPVGQIQSCDLKSAAEPEEDEEEMDKDARKYVKEMLGEGFIQRAREAAEKDSKGVDPKDPEVIEAATFLAQALGGDVEPHDVIDAVQTHRRVQPDDEVDGAEEPPQGDNSTTPGPGGEAQY